MAVDQTAIDEMARIRRILNGEYSQEITTVAQNAINENNSSNHERITGSNATADMAAILKMFNHGAEQSIERISESQDDDSRFTTALVTDKTANGVKVGSWEIKVSNDCENKTYDICNVKTDEPLARDLTLYESAVAICKLLNKQVSINSRQIREVLSLEDDYSKARTEAALFKRKARRMNESQNHFEANVAEDRYNESRTLALKFREKLVNISKSL